MKKNAFAPRARRARQGEGRPSRGPSSRGPSSRGPYSRGPASRRPDRDTAGPRPPAPTPSEALQKSIFGTLDRKILQAVAAKGYETPTPVQEQCIPPLVEGRDLIGSAQTGTGKTAAFTLPLLQRLLNGFGKGRPRPGTPRALVLAPTRELAAQIGESIRNYGCYLPFRHTVIFGGVNQYPQVKALARGVDILVATPGRLLDLMNQRRIHLNEVAVFVLDEVDRMLDMGFIDDIKRIIEQVPDTRQTMFFSATMPAKMEELAGSIVRDPVRVTIAPEAPAVDRITQSVYFVGKQNKDALLKAMLEDDAIRKAVIFTQMKHVAGKLATRLEREGITCTALHGDMSQGARTRALQGFRKGKFRVLVATDVAARGLDVDDITHVINYDLPTEAETYIHRVGRTARAGASGDAISFCSADERGMLHSIERLLGNKVPADLDHPFHCEEAFRSRRPAGRSFGGKKKGRGRGMPSRQSRRRSGPARPRRRAKA